jgi:hypothetical protein
VYLDPRQVQTLTGGANQPVTANFYFDPKNRGAALQVGEGLSRRRIVKERRTVS